MPNSFTYDNAIKRRPQEKTTAKPRSEDEPEEQSSQVSYTRAVKGDER